MLNQDRLSQLKDLMAERGWDLLLLYGHSWRKDFFRCLINVNFSGPHALAAVDRSGEVCAVANDNAPGQVVVSGHHHTVERAIAIAREHGARRAIMLPVSAPFHSPLMAPAAAVMEEALEGAALCSPVVPPSLCSGWACPPAASPRPSPLRSKSC